MSHYLIEDNLFWPVAGGAQTVLNRLPAKTYTVGHSMKGFYLKEIDDFRISGKVYGNTGQRAERVLNTFKERPHTTGVLLSGEKGSGKTLLTKMISQKAAEDGIPTLVINTPFGGDAFNSFIQGIDEPCVVVFDEFEKVFDEEQQNAILTLLDGMYPTKKLFLLTVNDKYRVNQHMKNRPGRIYYMLEYKGIDKEFIREYCEDNLNNKQYIEQVCRLGQIFESFNFDMLKAVVEEMNRYNESPAQVLEMLNAKPTDHSSMMYDCEVHYNGEKVTDGLYNKKFRGNPISQNEIEICFNIGPDEDNQEYKEIIFTQNMLFKIEPEEGKFTYVFDDNSEKVMLTLTREANKYSYQNYSYLDAI